MHARPWVLAETNWKAVHATRYDVAVLPWGATEAHNYHLPYATDTIQCDHIAARSGGLAWQEGARCIILPTIAFGVQTGQIDLPLHINMNPSTQYALLSDIVEALAHQNIPKLVILNGHGGNDFKQMIRELSAQCPAVFVCQLNWFQMLDASKYFNDPGDHAGEMETSLIMHFAPDWVLPLEEAGSGAEAQFKIPAMRARKVWAPRHWPSATQDTGIGNPAASSAEKGARYCEDLTRAIADFLIEFAATEIDDLYERHV